MWRRRPVGTAASGRVDALSVDASLYRRADPIERARMLLTGEA
jgi:hypothetical protein